VRACQLRIKMKRNIYVSDCKNAKMPGATLLQGGGPWASIEVQGDDHWGEVIESMQKTVFIIRLCDVMPYHEQCDQINE